MATTRKDISEWFDRGVESNFDYMLIVCDTFDYEDYPVFCKTEDFEESYDKRNGQNMQKIMEVYNLSLNKEMQLKEHRAFHMPVKEK